MQRRIATNEQNRTSERNPVRPGQFHPDQTWDGKSYRFGYEHCDCHEGYFVAKKLNEFGYDVAILLYHVSAGKQTRELAIADAKAALALLQRRGGEFGLSTRKIGVMGFSAGGHLAARLTHATAAGTPPDFVVLMYPAYLEQGGKVLDDVAPVKTPAFVYVAGDDKLAPSAIAYARACREANTNSIPRQPPSDRVKVKRGSP